MSIKTLWKTTLFAFLCAVTLNVGAQAESAKNAYVYETPEAAVGALIAAVKAGDTAEILKILHTDTKGLVLSGDETADKAERAAFVAAYEKAHTIATNERGHRILVVGEQEWPFPIPLNANKQGNRWSFDGKLGVEEILDRRIGRNELSAIQVAQAYIDAQHDYYRLNPEKATVPHFAQKIASQPGKRDGLYWESKEGEAPSPLGALVALAEQEGYKGMQQGAGQPYHGYRYRILTGQGKNAPGGAYSYIENGLMFGGFALIAYPDNYGVSGVMSFIVNQDGVVYEKNLGKKTASLAEKIKVFDPDETWGKLDLSQQK